MRVVGDLAAFDPELRRLIAESEQRTERNDRLKLTVCANYGGRWDIAQAARRAADRAPAAGAGAITEDDIAACLALSFAPDPDLLIRTGGEQRLSDFLLWECAYAELYFTDHLWPDFGPDDLAAAVAAFHGRERRFGGLGRSVSAA
jgi:undecaprenyl diphosphate synthase